MVIQIHVFKQIADFIPKPIFDNSRCFATTGLLVLFDCQTSWP